MNKKNIWLSIYNFLKKSKIKHKFFFIIYFNLFLNSKHFYK